jgi:hypothetical protein
VTGLLNVLSNMLANCNVRSYAVTAMIGVFLLMLLVDLIIRAAASPSTIMKT